MIGEIIGEMIGKMMKVNERISYPVPGYMCVCPGAGVSCAGVTI